MCNKFDDKWFSIRNLLKFDLIDEIKIITFSNNEN